MRDDLGDRMKKNYEQRCRYYLPRRTFTMIRVDGKSFHSYTKDCKRPFDYTLINDMDKTALSLCEQIPGAVLAFVQSDEISLVLTDFTRPETEAWFDGNVQKIASVSASLATAAFNKARLHSVGAADPNFKMACFDSRVWSIPDQVEVINYFIWRQADAMRNSIQMAARSEFSHQELDGVNIQEALRKLKEEKDISWDEYPDCVKQERWLFQEETEEDLSFEKDDGTVLTLPQVKRKHWRLENAPLFKDNWETLKTIVKDR